MRQLNYYFVAIPGVILLLCIQYGDGTLMLTSLLMAAQTGMLVGKMSVGGLLMMLMAAHQQNSGGYGGARSAGSTLGSARSTMGTVGSSRSRRHKREGETDPEEKVVRDRLVRQIDSAFDSFTCLPKFVCGLNAAPPSKKTSLLNDYGHLVKLIFQEDKPDTDADDDVSDEEDSFRTDDEYRLAMKEKNKLKDMVHEEMIEEDPGMISYVLKDVMQEMQTKKNPNRQSPGPTSHETYGSGPGYLPESEEEEKEKPSLLSFSPLKKIASAFRFPTLKIKTSGTSDTTFEKDPFFEGFKRSVRSVASKENEEDVQGEDYSTRARKAAYLKQKETELDQVTDPVQKYEIAEDIGKNLKNQQDCAAAFKKCPYEWNQVMEMVNNLRQNVLSRPGAAAAVAAATGAQQSILGSADKVVFLKTSDGKVGTGVPLNLNNNDGITTVTHDLGNGNTVEISMKLFKIQKKKNHSNSTEIDDDELDNIETTPKPASGLAEIPDNATVITIQDLADDEFESSANLESAAKIFQAINSGQMKPLKKKNAFPTIVEPNEEESQSSKKPGSKESSKTEKDKVKVSDDQYITLPLKINKDKKKEVVKEKEDTSEEEEDDFDDELLGFRGMILDKTRPSSNGNIGYRKNPTTSEVTAQKRNGSPIYPPPLMRRRYPGTVPLSQ